MALSADTNRVFELGVNTTVPVKASSQIYLGSAVGFTSGYARALVAGDDFAGFALENKLGTTDGAVKCAVSPSGQVQLSITSLAVTDIGKPVYASDDGTFTLTQGSNSKIGTVSRWVSTGVGIIRYAAQGAGADLTGVTVLTDNSGGASADGTIGAVTAPTAIGATLTDSTTLDGSHDDTVAAIAALTDYTPHASGGTTVTSNAATDLDTTAAALETFRDEQAARNTVIAQNISDITQKVIELVTAQGEDRTAIVALTDAVKELSTKVNEIINAAS